MKEVRRILAVGLMAAVLLVTGLGQTAFAQKGNDKRPPKEQPKIKEQPKPKPPPKNNNSGGGNRRGRP